MNCDMQFPRSKMVGSTFGSVSRGTMHLIYSRSASQSAHHSQL